MSSSRLMLIGSCDMYSVSCLLLFSVFGLFTGDLQVVKAQTPAPPGTADPNGDAPWKHVLKGADAKVVEEQEKQVGALERAGEYEKAADLADKILATRGRLQGAAHWETADARRRGETLRFISKQAVPVQKETALAAQEALTADSLAGKGQNKEAEPLIRKNIERLKRVLGEEHHACAAWYERLGWALLYLGNFVEAKPWFERALAIRLKTQGEDHPDTAWSYCNLGSVLDSQGHYADAEQYWRKAVETLEKGIGPEHTNFAYALNGFAVHYNNQRKAAQAEPLLRRALEIWRKALGEDDPGTALAYHNLAVTLIYQNKFDDAEHCCRQALKIWEKTRGPNSPNATSACNNLAMCLGSRGKFAESEILHQRCLDQKRKAHGDDHPDLVLFHYNLAKTLAAQQKYQQAEEHFIKSAHILQTQRFRIAASGLERAAFDARNSPLLDLAALQVRQGKAVAAWQYLESYRARALLEELALREEQKLTNEEAEHERQLLQNVDQVNKQIAGLSSAPAKQERQSLEQQRNALQIEIDDFELQQIKKLGGTQGKVYSLETIQEHLPDDAAMIAWLKIPEVKGLMPSTLTRGYWVCIVRKKGGPLWVSLQEADPQKDWGREEDRLVAQVHELFANDPARMGAPEQALVAKLARHYLDPIEPHLRARDGLPDVQRLIVLQVGKVPLEALTDKYLINYAPSGTFYAWLREEQKRAIAARGSQAPRLFALGDPAFKKQDLVVKRSGSGRNDFANLDGTRAEINAIARLFDDPVILLGADASGQRLEEWAASGELGKFRYLHLATHGVPDAQVPFQSALILADGRLTAQRLLHIWGGKLDADLVTLSACDSGLGAYQRAEDFQGFAHALFLAGARSVVVSLWKVDDIATSLLMTRFYQNLLGKRPELATPLSKAQSLREAKAWLRNLTAQDVAKLTRSEKKNRERGEMRPRKPLPTDKQAHPFEHPHYWAAFILIGDPG